jgi:predicted nucleotidyltransferase
MIQKYSRYRILQEFLDFPLKDFQMREVSRRVGVAQSSVINHLKELEKEGLILKEKKGIYPTFKSNRDNETFKIYKKFNTILKITKTKLLDYIEDSCLPNSIILFGSAARGEDIESSDIDLFVECKEKKINVTKYRKLLNRGVSLFFKEDFSKLNKELKNNILNGTILRGYIKVF